MSFEWQKLRAREFSADAQTMHSNAMHLHKQIVEGGQRKSYWNVCHVFGENVGQHRTKLQNLMMWRGQHWQRNWQPWVRKKRTSFIILCTDATASGILHLRHFDDARASLAALEARDAIRRGSSNRNSITSNRAQSLPKKMLFSESDDWWQNCSFSAPEVWFATQLLQRTENISAEFAAVILHLSDHRDLH